MRHQLQTPRATSCRDLFAKIGRVLAAVAIGLGGLPLVAFAQEAVPTAAQDTCLMCHKYAGLGRYETLADGRKVKRVFYVSGELHSASYHARLNCSDCHEGVDKIPHTGAAKVDCAKLCHVVDPSTGRRFTHSHIVEDLRKSAHGFEGSRSADKRDLPTCRDCHSNKPYQLPSRQQVRSLAFIKVCLQCHEEKTWVERFYRHVSYRVSQRRPSREVVALCSKCHANPDMMKRHELDVVIGFQDTYHGKAIVFGDEEVANCLNCHATYALGFSPHRITSGQNPKSPVHPDNKLATCAQAGCHNDATQAFATGSKMHPSLLKVAQLTSAPAGPVDPARREEIFQAQVIEWIKLFYQVLIAVVIGGLGGHRLLDIYAAWRDRKKGAH